MQIMYEVEDWAEGRLANCVHTGGNNMQVVKHVEYAPKENYVTWSTVT